MYHQYKGYHCCTFRTAGGKDQMDNTALELLHLKFIVYWNIFHLWKRRLCPAQVRMFEHDWIIALGEWYKHSIIFFITDGNKVSSFYTLTKKEHLNCFVKFIPAPWIYPTKPQRIIHGAGMNITKQFRFSMDNRFTNSSSIK